MKTKLMMASLFMALPLWAVAPAARSHHSGRPQAPATGRRKSANTSGATLNSQTRIQAKLKSKLDTRHARVGQQVQAVTTAQVKSHGRVVLPKGTRLMGRITSVQAAANSHARSSLGVLFNQAITRHGRRMPIHASIVQVLSMRSQMQAGFNPPAMAQPPMAGGGAISAGGGLAGGLGGTLGGAVGSTAQVAGNAGAGLGSSLGTQAHAMSQGLLRASNGTAFRVLPVAAAGNSQSSLLVAPHGNLVLNSGTRMVLSAGPASAAANSSTSAQVRR